MNKLIYNPPVTIKSGQQLECDHQKMTYCVKGADGTIIQSGRFDYESVGGIDPSVSMEGPILSDSTSQALEKVSAPPAVQAYALGFMFSLNGDKVLLIQKKRPDWQAGKFNGIGGHMELEELPEQCMAREFKEETDIDTLASDWKKRAVMSHSKWYVHVFATRSNKLYMADQLTDERPLVIDLGSLCNYNLIPNLHWMIPLCLDTQIKEALLEYE